MFVSDRMSAVQSPIIPIVGKLIRDHPGTTLEFLPGTTVFSEEQKQLMTDLSLAARRPLNWNVLAPTSINPGYVEAQLSAGDYARERGAEVIALTVPQPMTVRINLHAGFVFFNRMDGPFTDWNSPEFTIWNGYRRYTAGLPGWIAFACTAGVLALLIRRRDRQPLALPAPPLIPVSYDSNQ